MIWGDYFGRFFLGFLSGRWIKPKEKSIKRGRQIRRDFITLSRYGYIPKPIQSAKRSVIWGGYFGRFFLGFLSDRWIKPKEKSPKIVSPNHPYFITLNRYGYRPSNTYSCWGQYRRETRNFRRIHKFIRSGNSLANIFGVIG